MVDAPEYDIYLIDTSFSRLQATDNRSIVQDIQYNRWVFSTMFSSLSGSPICTHIEMRLSFVLSGALPAHPSALRIRTSPPSHGVHALGHTLLSHHSNIIAGYVRHLAGASSCSSLSSAAVSPGRHRFCSGLVPPCCRARATGLQRWEGTQHHTEA